MTESKHEKLGLWLQWIGASAIGGFVFAVLARRVSMAAGGTIGDSFGPVAAEVVIGALALGGIMVGIAAGQWLVVRRSVAWAGWMVLAMVAGGMAGGATGFGVLQGLGGVDGGAFAVAVAVVAGLVALGGVGWLLLRGRASAVGRFAWRSMAAVVAAVAATGLSGIALGEYSGGGVGGAVFGAVYAGVTGFVVLPSAGGRSQ
ncbi:MAG: hypothetical protein OXL34_05310 [Gemmatimonadota bacterium]|nr:hypothetical protein [Gemmatimonadota bacterium]